MKILWKQTTYEKKVAVKTEMQDITSMVSKFSWSGASTQASRQITLTIPNAPYDKNMNVPAIEPGAIIEVYTDDEGKDLIFTGRVPNSQKTSDVGTIEVTAYDYMHNLLASSMTMKFTNKTPEYITKAVLKDMGVEAGAICATGKKIARYFPNDMSPYDIIVGAYNKVQAQTGKQYFFRMNGKKFEVIEKGEVVSTILEESVNLMKANYEENGEAVVNRVKVYNKNNELVNTVKKEQSIKKFGIIEKTITVDKGKGDEEAKNTLHGIDKNASISATGIWSCTAGKGVYIQDTISGLYGEYWIKNDTHNVENGIHTMDLDLEFQNVMEQVNISEVEEKGSGSGSSTSSTTGTVTGTGGTGAISSGATVTSTETQALAADSVEPYATKTLAKKATFTAYASGGKAKSGEDLSAARMTCAAASSISFDSKIKVDGTGTQYDGVSYRVNDRPEQDMSDGRVNIQILVGSEAEAKEFGTRTGTVLVERKIRNKNRAANLKARKVVKTARNCIGTVRYVPGSSDVSGGRSDSVGFTAFCYKKVGVDIGTDIDTQTEAGTQISKSEAKIGDLVILKDTSITGPSAAGIMVNEKQFIHCARSGVKISSLRSSYYMQHFHSVRRVL